MELRCPSRIQAVLVGDFSCLPLDAKVEIQCPAKHCGAGGGVVVLHVYTLADRELVETKRYKNPNMDVTNRR